MYKLKEIKHGGNDIHAVYDNGESFVVRSYSLEKIAIGLKTTTPIPKTIDLPSYPW